MSKYGEDKIQGVCEEEESKKNGCCCYLKRVNICVTSSFLIFAFFCTRIMYYVFLCYFYGYDIMGMGDEPGPGDSSALCCHCCVVRVFTPILLSLKLQCLHRLDAGPLQ